jgi:hypothetical protein
MHCESKKTQVSQPRTPVLTVSILYWLFMGLSVASQLTLLSVGSLWTLYWISMDSLLALYALWIEKNSSQLASNPRINCIDSLLTFYGLSVASRLTLLCIGSLWTLYWISMDSLLALYALWIEKNSSQPASNPRINCIDSLLTFHGLSVASRLTLLSIGSLWALHWLSMDSLLALYGLL